MNARTPLATVLSVPEGSDVLEQIVPEVLTSPWRTVIEQFPIRSILRHLLGGEDPRTADILERISTLADPRPAREDEQPITPSEDYEAPGTPRASAHVELPAEGRAGETAEIVFTGPSHGNPFVDVDLQATITMADTMQTIGGFYDGDGRYLIRFLPPREGTWSVTTRSNARSLDGIRVELGVQPRVGRGPVRAAGTGFEHADGSAYLPFGTTAYAWTFQDEETQEATLQALAGSPFNKIRMCLFPKHFFYNSEEPARTPWQSDGDGGWDTTRFDLDYWRHLEQRIRQLGSLGVEADLILFHPYDRWGFSTMTPTVDERYVRYAVRRLGGLTNVWWSLANEWDLLPTKSPSDWERLGTLVAQENGAGRPVSIHNWMEIWDNSSPWVTHCSIQHGQQLPIHVDTWLRKWRKPVVVDECGYEGDLDQEWGNLTAEELVHRFWEVVMHGGYATHGETFWREDEMISWSKGGPFRGESAARLAFLRSIVAELPAGRITGSMPVLESHWAGDADHTVIYFGRHRPAFRVIDLPDDGEFRIDVIDTWNMTVTPLPGTHRGTTRVALPARPHLAIRYRRSDVAPGGAES